MPRQPPDPSQASQESSDKPEPSEIRISTPPAAQSNTRPTRRFANRVWRSTLRKEASQQAVRPGAVAILPGSPLFDKCLQLASDTALPIVDLLQEPAWEMPDHLLQAVWARIVPGGRSPLGDGIEQSSALLQAARSSGTSFLLTLPRDHFLWQADAFCETVHDSGLCLCDEPGFDNILLASMRLPTWPAVDAQLTALECAGHFACLPFPAEGPSRLSLPTLLGLHTPLVQRRTPICDGAGNSSSADWSSLGPNLAICPNRSSHIWHTADQTTHSL